MGLVVSRGKGSLVVPFVAFPLCFMGLFVLRGKGCEGKYRTTIANIVQRFNKHASARRVCLFYFLLLWENKLNSNLWIRYETKTFTPFTCCFVPAVADELDKPCRQPLRLQFQCLAPCGCHGRHRMSGACHLAPNGHWRNRPRHREPRGELQDLVGRGAVPHHQHTGPHQWPTGPLVRPQRGAHQPCRPAHRIGALGQGRP